MTSLALDLLLNNKKSSPFVLINDTVRFSALPILADIGKRALSQGQTLIVLLTETSPKAWRERFPKNNHNNIFIIDCFTDPHGWDDITEEDNTIQVRDIKDLEKSILSPILEKATDTPNCTILVDSITALAMISQYRTYRLVKALESLTTDAIRLVIGFHSDVKLVSKIGLSLEDSLIRIASVIVKLEALKERTHFDTQAALTGFVPEDAFSYLTTTSNCITKGGIAHIEWRKKSGKVQYESNGFVLDTTTGLLEVVHTLQLTGVDEEEEKRRQEAEEKAEAMDVDKKNDPTANLSFNLSLTDEQRKTKESLVLPYMKAQQLEVSSEEEKKNSGLIYYDPDAADDFDDEDPDDDLDI
ncbi:Elongator complex protein 5 [Cokeromyces recurvatus]|uniref:Elongator complex protein 5 n=1 Tax=Cokeromyces recurvatus TaxID=90255 RepID=UPI0022206DC8|nr:Elongator complex protein 5 [Cokeromyces recurvatus]KAI7904334.1 Elongator complex protein 5 [Cokeromyces recurvatus]